MEKQFEAPIADVILFDNGDIITFSAGENEGNKTDGDE